MWALGPFWLTPPPRQDLCARHEKGLLHKPQRALHSYSLMKRPASGTAGQTREPESVQQLESRILEVVLVCGRGPTSWGAFHTWLGWALEPCFRRVLGWLDEILGCRCPCAGVTGVWGCRRGGEAAPRCPE